MLKKYEFTSKEEFEALDTQTNHKPILLGHVVLEKAEYDKEGNEIKEPVLSDKFCVDIYWDEKEYNSEIYYDLESHEVFPKNPIHKIAGQ